MKLKKDEIAYFIFVLSINIFRDMLLTSVSINLSQRS